MDAPPGRAAPVESGDARACKLCMGSDLTGEV